MFLSFFNVIQFAIVTEAKRNHSEKDIKSAAGRILRTVGQYLERMQDFALKILKERLFTSPAAT
jgi:hypothetical protein